MGLKLEEIIFRMKIRPIFALEALFSPLRMGDARQLGAKSVETPYGQSRPTAQ
jgi:hypothetical protein